MHALNCTSSFEVTVKWGKNSQNNKPSFYTPAITPRDEINMLVDRGYFREPSLKMVSVHSN